MLSGWNGMKWADWRVKREQPYFPCRFQRILRLAVSFRILAFFCCLWFVVPTAHAQPGFGVELNYMGGRILKHTKNFRAPVPPYSQAVELNFIQQTDGNKQWQQRRRYPLWGAGLVMTNYGDNANIGTCYGINANLQFPLVRAGRFEWTGRIGAGISYVTRRFSLAPEWDTLNTAISSHFNNFTLFTTDFRYFLSDHWAVQVGGQFSHISNGALRQPNLGINFTGLHAGVRWYPQSARPPHIHDPNLPHLSNRWLAQARLGFSFTESGYANGPLYPVGIATVYASKRYLSKNKALIGLDASVHPKIYAFMRANEVEPGKERAGSWKAAVFVGHEWLMGRAGLQVQVGYYVKKAWLNGGNIYQKLGANYYLVRREHGALKELFLSCFLKTHLAQAELGEFAIGWGF